MRVFRMQRGWSDKNVDLELLTSCIGDFFEEREFDMKKGKSSNGYQVLAENSPLFELDGYVIVAVVGHPNDFVVSLDFCEGKKRKGFLLGPFTASLFGGGRIFLRRLKLGEDWVELKREFWQCVENVLLRLANSAEY
jgi:hypothetical protein